MGKTKGCKGFVYLKHSQSEGAVQITVRLHHSFTVTAVYIHSGDAFCSLVDPVQQLARHI